MTSLPLWSSSPGLKRGSNYQDFFCLTTIWAHTSTVNSSGPGAMSYTGRREPSVSSVNTSSPGQNPIDLAMATVCKFMTLSKQVSPFLHKLEDSAWSYYMSI